MTLDVLFFMMSLGLGGYKDLGPHVYPYVIRVCFVTSEEDMVIHPVQSKDNSNICVWDVKDCSKAELWVRKATLEGTPAYISKSSNECR